MLANPRIPLAALTVSAALFATSARAQYCYGTDCLLTTTTTIGGTSTTTGVIVLIVWLATKKDEPSPAAAKAAELYLRHSFLELAQDLATGRGPVLDDLTGALHVSHENREAFHRLLRQDRKELLALADVRTLDPPRAVQFFQRILSMMQARPELARDLQQVGGAQATN